MIDGHGSASIPVRTIPASRLKRVIQLGGASLPMNLTLVGTSRCDVPAREAAGGIVAPLNAARTAQRAVPTRFRGLMREIFRGNLSMNRPSPGLRPPSPRFAGRGQGEGCQSGSWSQCMRKNGRRLSMNQVGRDSVEPYFRSLEIRAESRPTVHDDLCKFKKADAPRRGPGARIAGANCRVALKHATGVLAAQARE